MASTPIRKLVPKKATFAAGCFWGVEEAFRTVEGVVSTTVGYTGGRTINPTYEQVCEGNTGHAEAVQIEYDPKKTSYERLLTVFWASHDPTTHNRQGPDVGEQYRSVIFFHDKEQEKAAKKSKEMLDRISRFERPIVTSIEPAEKFYKAEEFHQKYLLKNDRAACHI
ncbi:MAG: peptide-methionine (S)-S-oxide reductase MsrA [Candidatus Micrarchaeota archaeon]